MLPCEYFCWPGFKFWSQKHKKLGRSLILKSISSVCLPICLSRLCLQEGSIYLRPSCTPTWRAVGWGQFWWGEAKSWRWCRRTSTLVHTTRWATAGLSLPRGTRGQRSIFCARLEKKGLLHVTLSFVPLGPKLWLRNEVCLFLKSFKIDTCHIITIKSWNQWN